MAKTSALDPFEEIADADLLTGVDVSDTTMAETGTNKSLTWLQLKTWLKSFFDGFYPLRAEVPLYYPAIVGLTGGGETGLDGIATTALSARTLVMVVVDEVLAYWMLYAGTDAENAAGGIVRPDDYDDATNAKVWKKIA